MESVIKLGKSSAVNLTPLDIDIIHRVKTKARSSPDGSSLVLAIIAQKESSTKLD